GVITGPVSVNGGSIAPGDNAVGLLTVSNDVTLSSGATTLMKIDKTAGTNDLLRVTGNLNYDGTLTISNLSAALAGGDSFQLFTRTAATGNFAGINSSPGDGLDWKFNPANGVLTVYSTVSTNINASMADGVLQISWPADHLGWRLQIQTNGVGGTWVD